MDDDAKTSQFGPELRGWRVHNSLAILKLKIDLGSAGLEPMKHAGDLVLGRLIKGDASFLNGWMIEGLGHPCVVNEPYVEVIEAP